jgi:hypothetical protein
VVGGVLFKEFERFETGQFFKFFLGSALLMFGTLIILKKYDISKIEQTGEFTVTRGLHMETAARLESGASEYGSARNSVRRSVNQKRDGIEEPLV